MYLACFVCDVFSIIFMNKQTPLPWWEGCLFVSCFVGQRWPKATFVPKRYLCFPLRKGSDVELVGFEPTSKQGNHTLSTRLFRPSVFVHWQDPDHQPMPYPLKFYLVSEASLNYFRFICTALSAGFGTTASERCLVPLPCNGIKPEIYYTSIRQRERNFFRQLNFW